MPTLHLTRGLPASGKTTFARSWVAENPAERIRINRDDVRAMIHQLHGGVTEFETTRVCHAAVRACLRAGRDVICDDTNLNAKFVKTLLKIAAQTGADVEFHDFPADGGHSVGSEVIRSMYDRYLDPHHGQLPPRPQLPAGPKFAPYVPIPGTPKAVLVDLDGTVAHNDGHRSFYDYSKVRGDSVHHDIVELVKMFAWAYGYKVIFVSGREDICREDTIEWLADRCDLREGEDYIGLFMRDAGDGRDDGIVKLEIFDREIRDHYDVRYVLDDRDRVVAAWRSIGLRVLQVQDGDF